MRSYPANSPQTAARVAALTVVADGDIGETEIEWLKRLAVHEQLGLARRELHALLDTFRGDLLSSDLLKFAAGWPMHERTLAVLMGAMQDSELRSRVALADCDAHVAQSKSLVLGAAVEHWGLHRKMFGSLSEI